MRGRRRSAAAAAVTALAAAVLVGCTHPAPRPAASGPGATPGRPNIVFVLADDLSWNLVPYMPHVLALERQGTTFTDYTVTDSLCCPSRASILTGEFPHDTGIVTNGLPDGGFFRFRDSGDEAHTVATSLAGAGYRTALFGKYLNQFDPAAGPAGTPPGQEQLFGQGYVPPGWTSFGGVDNGGYGGYDYRIVDDAGAVRTAGHAPGDYVTHVLGERAVQFAGEAVTARQPFFLELASFAPHKPYVPAPEDIGTFPGLRAPVDASFGRPPTDPPPWLRAIPPLSARARALIDTDFQLRVEAVQGVDRAIGRLEQLLGARHQLADTVFVFSSDNGYHMGEHGLLPGKQTAFDTDVRVPLVVAGPGIPAGRVDTHVVENIDLAPTFDELAGVTPPARVDGHSLVALLHGRSPVWRGLAGIEHHGPDAAPGDPDAQTPREGDPPSYDAIRSAHWVYVRYRADGAREFYDLDTDPLELHDVAASLQPAFVARLDAELDAMVSCHGAQQCWAAGRPGQPTSLRKSQLTSLVGRTRSQP